jgi:hypothetical protein
MDNDGCAMLMAVALVYGVMAGIGGLFIKLMLQELIGQPIPFGYPFVGVLLLLLGMAWWRKDR